MGALLLLVGCADKQVSDESSNPFGDGTAGSSTSVPPGDADGDADGTMGTMGTADASGEGPGTGTAPPPPTTGDPSSGGEPTTDAPTTDMPGESTGTPDTGELGDCIGTGAWENCAQYCQANLDVCAPGGCGGQTVVYYNDVEACVAMQADGGEAIGCNEGFAMGGGISFARCCCA